MTVKVNNTELYYEKCGNGVPLIMIHGNGETHAVFDTAITLLKEHFTVYAIDSRGHGKSASCKEFHYDDMAEDIFCFINELKIEKPVFYGFSDGGIIGLIASIRHPDIFSNMIISGANLSPSGLKHGFLLSCKIGYFFSRSKLLRLMIKEPHITDEMLEKINIPTFVTCGSKDIVKLCETKHICDTIKSAKLKVFDGETHGSYICNSEKIAKYILSVI